MNDNAARTDIRTGTITLDLMAVPKDRVDQYVLRQIETRLRKEGLKPVGVPDLRSTPLVLGEGLKVAFRVQVAPMDPIFG